MESGKLSLRAGQVLSGPLFSESMRVETVQSNGPGSWVVGLVGVDSERFRRVTLTDADVESLTILESRHTFDGDGRLLRLGLQAYALGIAYEFDPYFGLSISRVDPLPHQLARSFLRKGPRWNGRDRRPPDSFPRGQKSGSGTAATLLLELGAAT
jgi:hypothetical protein